MPDSNKKGNIGIGRTNIGNKGDIFTAVHSTYVSDVLKQPKRESIDLSEDSIIFEGRRFSYIILTKPEIKRLGPDLWQLVVREFAAEHEGVQKVLVNSVVRAHVIRDINHYFTNGKAIQIISGPKVADRYRLANIAEKVGQELSGSLYRWQNFPDELICNPIFPDFQKYDFLMPHPQRYSPKSMIHLPRARFQKKSPAACFRIGP